MVTKKVKIYVNDKNVGWLGNNQRWWFDPNFKHSFEIFDIDYFYEKNYFENDHVENKVVEKLVDLVQECGLKITNKPIKNILEIGCGGGWFMEGFARRGISVTAIEGSSIGFKKSLERIKQSGCKTVEIIKHDIRLPINLGKKFDMILCTEVAEHIEPPFSSTLVGNLVQHGDLIWFSSEAPATNDAHYHHSNEQPVKFWSSLFQFFGYDMYMIDPNLLESIANRGGYLVIKNTVSIPEQIFNSKLIIEKITEEKNLEELSLGSGPETANHCYKTNQNNSS